MHFKNEMVYTQCAYCGKYRVHHLILSKGRIWYKACHECSDIGELELELFIFSAVVRDIVI